MKPWILVAAVLFVLLCITVVYFAAFAPSEPVQAARAQAGPIREYIDEQGKTRLPETHLITMPFAGRVDRITLEENKAVRADEIVARVSPSELQLEVAEAAAVVARFEAAINESQNNQVESTVRDQAEKFVEAMVDTVAAANERMTASQRRMEYAESFLANVRQLRESNAKSQDDVDRADVAKVESQVSFRQDVLVWQAMKSIQSATQLLPKMVNQYIDRKGLNSLVLEQQRAEAAARLRQAEIRQRRGEIKSPVSGIVLERLVSNERHLPAGEVLLKVGELERLEIEADVLSQDVVRVRPGDEVTIYGPAIGADVDNGVRGKVQRIFPTGFTKISSLGVEQQRVKVIIEFADGALRGLLDERDLGVDYRVRVRIYTAKRERGVIVPRSALFRGADGGWQVFAIRGGQARLQPVTVGLMNDEQAEITDGITEEEIVVLAPESNLVEGAKVTAILRD